MGRRKLYEGCYDIPNTVVDEVRYICADYFRREKAVKIGSVSGELLDNYIRINKKIDQALSDVLEEGTRFIMLDDIANRRGYEYSRASQKMGRVSYFMKKRKIIYIIAKYLLLY